MRRQRPAVARCLGPAAGSRAAFPWPVQAHHQVDGVVGRGQPVGLLRLSGRVFLDIERQRAIRILLHPGKHRRVDEIAIDGVLDQQLRLAVIHGHRPEGVHRRKLPFAKGQGVVVLAAVERFAVGRRPGQGIHCLHSVVAVDSAFGGGGPHQPVAVVEGAVPEERPDLPAIDVL